MIREMPGMTRVDLAHDLGYSASTVTRVVAGLMEEDLVIEGEATERAGAGRRPTSLFINGDAFNLLGVDIAPQSVHVAIVSLGGTIQSERVYPLDRRSAADEQIHAAIAESLSEAANAQHRVRAIGIGAPGVTLAESGIVRWAPAFGWRDFPLGPRVEERWGIPTFVENDVNLAAVGEYWFGSARGSDSLAYLLISEGMGSGLIIDGKLHRGRHYAAGEVGYIVPDRALLHGDFADVGAMETMLLSPQLGARRAEIAAERGETIGAEPLGLSASIENAQAGAPVDVLLADDILDRLAQTIASMTAVIDPGVIILGGDLVPRGEWIRDQLVARLERVLPADSVDLQVSQLGGRATVLGASAFALLEAEGLYMHTQGAPAMNGRLSR